MFDHMILQFYVSSLRDVVCLFYCSVYFIGTVFCLLEKLYKNSTDIYKYYSKFVDREQ
jgi:hypothetical protein